MAITANASQHQFNPSTSAGPAASYYAVDAQLAANTRPSELIEKVFAIRAGASDIYAALLRDIASAGAYESSLFEVLERERNRRLRLRATVGFVPCILTYTIDEQEEGDSCEVTARLEPYGWRWVAFQAATLGLRRQTFEMVLVQGLANLKTEVEREERATIEESIIETPL